MTLKSYDADRLDALSLRVLDVCVQLRHLALTARQEQLSGVELHDRKALEWIEKLEGWAIGAAADLNGQVLKARGLRHAAAMQKKSRR
jgi:hypothetical protein